uniref:Tamulustoxin family protein n=1 Tax=Podoviridae sp. ct8Lf7 TaxID=2827723 RepID=A0A8S5S0X9_9CAUD|nr:MAG TPA: Tamulustoxin family protein [Podoviridae sp. ct8Lf7]
MVNELATPCLIFVTASLYSIPFNLSLKTPVMDEVVCSTDCIANSIAWTAYAFRVSSNPLYI